MHPVDWMEVNKRNGVQQVLPQLEETDWFDVADLSFLKTPHNRKSYPRVLLAPVEEADEQNKEEEEENNRNSNNNSNNIINGYVVHSVETDLVFALDVPHSAKRAALLEITASLGAETPWPQDEPVPFSTIKKDNCALSRSLTRSKRSLFAVDIPRAAVDDSEEDESLEI